MSETKEQWYSRELLNARLAMERMEGVSRETVGALVNLIDETVVNRVSLWQARIAQLEADLRGVNGTRIATLEAIADARMTRIDELEAAYNEARVCLTYVRSWCDIDDVAMQLRMERWLDNEIRDSTVETEVDAEGIVHPRTK